MLGLFEDSRYKSESKKPSLKSVDIIGFGTGPELEKKLKYAEDVSYGVIFGRELTNSPANVLTPGMDCHSWSETLSCFCSVISLSCPNLVMVLYLFSCTS